MTVELSCGLPPGPAFGDLAVLAEKLGYARVWIFDSAPLWEDPFVHLALAAERTSRIGLGTAVLIPSERSEMAMASAIAAIARLSGGRFRACFGTGATARRTMGRRPLTLRALEEYVAAVRGLLAGETVTIEDQPARMLHAEGLAAPRPIDAEIWLSAFGPRAIELAARIADGIVGQSVHPALPMATMRAGTVLEPGEDRGAQRVGEAVGPWQVVAFHEAYAIGGAAAVDAMPGGQEWREALERLAPEGERHLLAYEGHVTHVTERDLPLVGYDHGFPTLIGEADEIRDGLEQLGERGVREVIYTPSGPDVARELRTFSAAARR
ncbi:LLM class flavin-dependent oxidoreductase [Actinomadura rugatobispora]|uniref:LLM class flavin-dependent oxidoreductase n=1 Tax=Actinomadura rugatobispora TaxID=1994 RepID=A0ABW0ZRZ4_9ACTN|nr:LLM class flavin-dependent oxidoreductase [Actinomadura rugatobispora]